MPAEAAGPLPVAAACPQVKQTRPLFNILQPQHLDSRGSSQLRAFAAHRMGYHFKGRAESGENL
jgi:hypothetical protein